MSTRRRVFALARQVVRMAAFTSSTEPARFKGWTVEEDLNLTIQHRGCVGWWRRRAPPLQAKDV